MYRIMPLSSSTQTTTIVGEWIICENGGDSGVVCKANCRKAKAVGELTGIYGFAENPSAFNRNDVDLEMRLFQCAVRTAFNRLLEDMNKGDVEKLVASMFNINSRYAKDAVMQAQSIISSQKELVKQHLPYKERAIKALRKKLENIKSEDKRKNISAKIEQLQEEVVVLEQHIAEGTIEKVIFGGRENFEKRQKGQISNADWKNLRNNKLYSRGDKSKEGGNLNTRIVIDNEGFSIPPFPKGGGGISMSVAISHKVRNGLTAPRVTGKLWIDVRHRERLREHLEDSGIYSIELIRGADKKYRVHITFDEFVPIEVVSFSHGAIGVDVNPDGIALTETDSEGNLVDSLWYSLPELTYSSKNRRDNLIGETAKEIVSIALAKGKGLVIESLNFVKLNIGKQFNRMSHNFVYRRLLESIERKAIGCGVRLLKVNPAYTSIIGKYKYATAYGLSFHQAAAFVIARRGLGFRERIPKKIQRLISSLISKLNSLLPAIEAKGRRQVKRLLNKLENWRNIHSWSFWYTFNFSLRKVGVKPWLLRDINSVNIHGILPAH